LFACAIIVSVAARPAEAQLRPLDPLPWRLFENNASILGEIGVARLHDQRASLAGTVGDLWELGTFALGWKTGRVIIEAAGTAQRIFDERRSFAPPYEDVEPSDDGRRHDSGDYRVSTAVRLTPDDWRTSGVLRFGTRLPTTDNTTGLERDAVDFFATVGASGKYSSFMLSGEAGLGIHTTREKRFEQDDLFLYSLRAEYRGNLVTPSLSVVGQMHGTTHSAIRGVENLGELRGGVRIGDRRWLRVELVRGYEAFSPSSGLIVSAGMLR
jgi:hypothetical protein